MSIRKILFVIPSMQQGGAERVVSIMANHWTNKGYNISIMTFDNVESYYTLEKEVSLYSLHSAKNSFGAFNFIVNNILRTVNYFKCIRKIKPDIIISFTGNANVYCILYNRVLKIPLIIAQRTNPRFNTLPAIINKLPRHIYKRADAIVVQTAETLKIYRDLDFRLPGKASVIFNPLSKTSYPDTNNVLRQKKVLAVGRLYNYDKHFNRLITIFSNINSDGWVLEIAGDGPDHQMLQGIIDNNKLGDKVKLLGGVKDLVSLYQEAKIFVLTSQYEGFPNSLCEAMANGCACISYDCATGPSEIIKHGHNGLLIENQNETAFATALAGLMNDEPAIHKFSVASTGIRQQLDEDKIMEQWDSLINEVIASRN